MQFHYLQQGNKAADVVAVVHERFLHRFAHRFAGCKMDDAYDVRELVEDVVQVHEIAAIDIREVRFTTDNRRDSVQDVYRRVGEVVHDGNVVALLHQFDHGM